MTRVSASQVSTYHACPRRWKHQYVDGLPRAEPTDAMQRGLAVHSVLEALGRLTLAGETPGVAESIETALCGLALSPVRSESVSELLGSISGQLDFARTVGVEAPIRIELGEDVVTGYVDRVDIEGGAVEVWDYKSGLAPPPSAGELETDVQVGAYLVWAREYWPEAEDISAVWWYLSSRRVRRIKWTPQLDRYHRREITATCDAMRAGIHTARPGGRCGYCPYTGLCKPYHEWLSEGLGPEAPESAPVDELVAARMHAAALESAAAARKKTLDERLRAVLGSDKRLRTEVGTVTRVQTTRRSVRPGAIAAVAAGLEHMDVEDVWSAVSSISHPKIRALAQSCGREDSLDEHVIESMSEHLRIREAKL